MAGKQPTPQGISALLRKARHARYRSARNAVYGGYRVTAGTRTGSVKVGHLAGMADRSPAAHAAALDAYTRTITGAGWAVERGEYCLIVTAKEDDTDG